MHIKPPVSYQGGKGRLAKSIVNILLKENKPIFYDLCCGSGAISIELVNRGVEPSKIWMVDKGPWGLVWEKVGQGTFDFNIFDRYFNNLPKDINDYKAHFENLSKQDASLDIVYVFLLLQAASFGSKPIWFESSSWKNCSFRSFWNPTETSNRRYSVNPMMPMPNSLRTRLEKVCEVMKGVNGSCENILAIEPKPNSVIYVDPPYQARTSYGYSFSIEQIKEKYKTKIFLSEGIKMNNNAILLATSESRKKGGICGYKKISANEEWLNIL